MQNEDSNESNETATYRFEGYSDDTFGEYGVTSDDWDNCASGEPIEFKLEHDGQGLVIVGQYCPGSCEGWLIGVAALDEDNVPDWPMVMHASCGDHRPYSPALLIKAPTGAVLTCITQEASS